MFSPDAVKQWEEVVNEGKCNWVGLGYKKASSSSRKNSFVLLSSGSGGLNEMKSIFRKEVIFGGLRVVGTNKDGKSDRRVKFVIIFWVPPSLSGIKKARVSIHKVSVLNKFFKYYSITIEANEKSQFSVKEIENRLNNACGSHKPDMWSFSSSETGNIKRRAKNKSTSSNRRGSNAGDLSVKKITKKSSNDKNVKALISKKMNEYTKLMESVEKEFQILNDQNCDESVLCRFSKTNLSQLIGDEGDFSKDLIRLYKGYNKYHEMGDDLEKAIQTFHSWFDREVLDDYMKEIKKCKTISSVDEKFKIAKGAIEQSRKIFFVYSQKCDIQTLKERKKLYNQIKEMEHDVQVKSTLFH